MRNHLVMAMLAAACLAPAAVAQEDWSGVPIAPGNGRITSEPGTVRTPKPALFGGEHILVTCHNVASFPTAASCPEGVQQDAFVPLSEFARSSTVLGLSQRVDGVEASFASAMGSLQGLAQQVDGLNKSVALSSALDIVLPVNGHQNRLGFQATDIAGENGLGLSYAHASGNFDIGLSVAAVGPEQAGKVGIGFSW